MPVPDEEGQGELVPEALGLPVPVPHSVAAVVGLVDAERVELRDGLCVPDVEPLSVVLTVGLALLLGEGEPLVDWDALTLLQALGVRVDVLHALPDTLLEKEDEGEAEGLPEGEALAVLQPLPEPEGERKEDSVPVPVWD